MAEASVSSLTWYGRFPSVQFTATETFRRITLPLPSVATLVTLIVP
jgi:hypothetical protein